MKMKHFINSHKAITGLVVLLMIAWFNQWNNATAWVYLALHGSYGILWLIKSQLYPDKRWEQPATLPIGIGGWIALSLFWIAPFIITSQSVQAPAPYLALCISIYIFGTFLHYVADMQKHMMLKLNPGHLITDGLWAITRNPNYLGELLTYTGFTLLAMHWLPLVILIVIVVGTWLPLIRSKEKSLARYPEFASYQKRVRMLIPFLF